MKTPGSPQQEKAQTERAIYKALNIEAIVSLNKLNLQISVKAIKVLNYEFTL